MNNTETYITTIGELNKHIGEIVVCFYYIGDDAEYDEEYYDSSFVRPYDEENISYMWALKLVKPINGPLELNPRYQDIYGEDSVCLIDIKPHNKKTPYFVKHEQHCNRQSYVRLPTKEELTKYKNILRYERIFGNDTHKNNKRT